MEKTEESERFRFGNGGILISRTRVRLPVLLLGRVVLVWINEIPCDSLGCLLGKDFMEALGTVIDFLGKKMLLKLLDDEKWIKLQKMKAGHFAVNLLPMSLSVWPGLRREPWVSVGTGSICEVQVESKRQWILNKLKTPKNLAHSELNVIEYYVPVDVSGSSFSEETFAPVPDVSRRDLTFLPSMAQDGDQAVVLPELELQRTSIMDGAERTSTVLANSPTSSGGCGDLEAAGPGHGAASSVAEVLASEMLGREELHADESQGVDSASRTARIGAILPGGWSDPDVSANVEEETTEGGRQSSPGRTTSTGGTDREPEEEEDRRAYWAERRASKAQGRIARAMRAVQRRSYRGDDRGQPDREAQASDRSIPRHRRDAPNSSGVGSSQSQSSATRPRPEPKAVAVPVLQGTPVNLQPLPSDHRMDPYAAQQIMALRALMAQHGEAGAERDHLGNPILQVEPEEMMRMLSNAAETVDSMSWEPEYGAETEFFHLDTGN